MKMGTIRSPCPYDAAARPALQSVNLRLPAILHYASCGPGFPILQGSPVSFDSGRLDQSRDRRDCARSGSQRLPRPSGLVLLRSQPALRVRAIPRADM